MIKDTLSHTKRDDQIKLQEEGRQEVQKEDFKEEEKTKRKFDHLISKQPRVLLKIYTIFPFDPFPNEIIIDEHKINIVYKEFFTPIHIHSILIKDVADVMVDSGLILANLRIIKTGLPTMPVEVGNLKRGEAIKARRIIQGLLVAIEMGVDYSLLDIKELLEKIEQLGKVAEVE